jgi:hypothetical protein
MPGGLRRNGEPAAPQQRVLVIGCGALGRELVALTRELPGVDLTCLPAELHNRPERIPAAVAARLRSRGGDYDRVFVAYADCGTGGLLDRVVEEEGVERLPGAHCYEVFAGRVAFAQLQDEEPGTFYLTDFLVRQFETLVLRGLGLDRHPELLPLYFGNYRRVVYLAQSDSADLVVRAQAAAQSLGLAFQRRVTGFGDLASAVVDLQSTDRPVASVEGGLPGASLAATQRTAADRHPDAPTRSARHPSIDPAATAAASAAANDAAAVRLVDPGATSAPGGPALPVDPAATTSRRSPRPRRDRMGQVPAMAPPGPRRPTRPTRPTRPPARTAA